MELQCNSFKVEINFVDIFGCTVVISRVNRLAIHFIFVTGFFNLIGGKQMANGVETNARHGNE